MRNKLSFLLLIIALLIPCVIHAQLAAVNSFSGSLLLKYYGITQNSVELYWSGDNNAVSYDVYQAEADLNFTLPMMNKVNTTPITTQSYTVKGLSAGSEYRFVVVANGSVPGDTLQSNQVNVPTAKQLSGTELESASGKTLLMPYDPMALNMEYKGPTLSDPKWFNWCVSPIKAEGKYHLFTSRWPDNMNNWMVKGQIVHSVSDSPEGPYSLEQVILCDSALISLLTPSELEGVFTDLPGFAPHNCRVKKIGDQYALTFIMQTSRRSVKGQKIALFVSDNINGPWRWAGDKKGFVVETSPDSTHWTYNSAVGTDNHDIIKVGDEYRIYFKAGVAQDARMHYGYAYSKSLEGPYTLRDTPSLTENKNYIEDATVFPWRGSIYLLSTDNHGSNTGVLGYGILWKSNDNGETFRYKDAKIGFGLIKDYIKWPVTGARNVYNGATAKFERPALLMDDNGNPEYFFGTLGMSLDGYTSVQNYLLKINLKPSSAGLAE